VNGRALDVIGTIARLGLAAVWLISGGIKAADSGQTYVAVRAYDVLPLDAVGPVAAVLPWLELALGLLLLVGLGVRAVALASVIRIVAYVIAVVLVAYVLLTLVGVNPLNAVAQVVGGVADRTVLAFRDLFLVADPVFAVVVNYGLAAVFWVLVAEFGSRLVRWIGARFS